MRTPTGAELERALASSPEAIERGWHLEYLRFHRERYAVLLRRCATLAGDRLDARALVVGPGYEAELLRRCWPAWTTDTFGFADTRFPPRDGEVHRDGDLRNLLGDGGLPEPCPAYDLVLVAEVLEHLPVPLPPVLGYLARWLDEERGLLVVQTPNAVALPNRLRMLAGRNPFELLSPSTVNPGHFREYTIAELSSSARVVGLEPIVTHAYNYFDRAAPSRSKQAYFLVADRLPKSLRHGLTMVLRPAPASS